ncbi:MAG: hypothetical protein RLZZ519_2915 [Bacteroidota bacterium]|jgi:hypothetical protein
METIQDIRVSSDRQQPKHVGGRVFWVAAALQFLAMVLLVAGFYFYQYQRFRKIEKVMNAFQLDSGDPQDSNDGWINDEQASYESYFWYWTARPFGMAFFAAGFIFCFGAWLSGRQAGKRIMQKRVPDVGAGILAMVGPSLAAAITLLVIKNVLRHRTWEVIGERLWGEGMIVFAGYTVMFLFPAVITGILAGIVTRHKLAAIEFKKTQEIQSEK